MSGDDPVQIERRRLVHGMELLCEDLADGTITRAEFNRQYRPLAARLLEMRDEDSGSDMDPRAILTNNTKAGA